MWDTLHNRARLGLFQDADFAGDLLDSKSVTDGIFFMSKLQMQEEHEEHSTNRVVANSLRETFVSLVLAMSSSRASSDPNPMSPARLEARQLCSNVAVQGTPMRQRGEWMTCTALHAPRRQ